MQDFTLRPPCPLNRYCPLPIRERRLANRIVVPPMASGTASPDGLATDATVAHYSRLADSGAGLVWVEYSYVDPTGRSEPHQLAADRDLTLPGLSRIARAIQSRGALAGLQLTHSGGKTERSFTGGAIEGPSAVSVPAKDQILEAPTPLDRAGIKRWRRAFVEAAGRAVRAGFDLVELHSAHGYGLNQFLSPITNQRRDEYGGSTEGRARLVLEIARDIRREFPQLLLSVRIPGRDFIDSGLTLADSIQLVGWLEGAGVDVIHVSSGIGGWRRPADRRGQGYLVPEAAAIQRATRLPVIGVGGIEEGQYIDTSLRAGRFALAAVGRAILKDASGWRARNLPLDLATAIGEVTDR